MITPTQRTYIDVEVVYNGWTAYDRLLATRRKFRNSVPVSKTFAVQDHVLAQYEDFGHQILCSQPGF